MDLFYIFIRSKRAQEIQGLGNHQGHDTRGTFFVHFANGVHYWDGNTGWWSFRGEPTGFVETDDAGWDLHARFPILLIWGDDILVVCFSLGGFVMGIFLFGRESWEGWASELHLLI